MSLFEDLSASGNTTETSNFAHVIFQNVAKSYLPHAALECHYTLTPYIKPHPKDWVGIFKVGWSTARDYYTFLWSPLSEKYVEGTSVNCVVVFQEIYFRELENQKLCKFFRLSVANGGVIPSSAQLRQEYLPNVAEYHKQEIMELYKIEEALKEKEELMKVMSMLQKEKDQLAEQAEKLGKAVDQEKEMCAQVKKDYRVGWSTARDYYTFLWSPLSEKYVEGTSVNCVVVFQGYYVPNDVAEFYQFCYVTHKGEIRGASTPFQFRATSPTDDLLTMEDESNSDILVVTTKAGMLEYKIEEALKEKEELMKVMSMLQKEKDQLAEQAEKLGKAVDQEKEMCAQVKKDYRDILNESQTFKDENEEIKKKYENATSRILELENDLIGVSQKAIEKETELDSIRGRLKKLSLEKELLESQLKNEKDEKELYKIQLKNTEMENTKLTAEVQTLKSVAVNKENMLTQLREESGMLKICIAEKEKAQKEMLTASSTKAETGFLREQLRKSEDQLQATRQEVSMLAAELRDVFSVRDRTMSDLYTARLEIDSLKSRLVDAEAECKAKEGMLQNMKAAAIKNEKESKKTTVAFSFQPRETAANPDTAGAVTIPPVSPASSDTVLDLLAQEKIQVMNKEMSERNKKWKQMLTEEKEKSSRYADELAKVELKLKEQFKINESLKLQLAAEEDRSKGEDDAETVQSAPSDTRHSLLQDHRTHFCFDSSIDVCKKCPLCEVIFPPNYDQSKFEEHVESHWKVCPICNEQFPLDFDQCVFEKHVQTHFDGNVLNFD
ncbi:UNVERIFIED_CONTAM: hypothetical protein FKN15_064029 [Acipenser sinensis]